MSHVPTLCFAIIVLLTAPFTASGQATKWACVDTGGPSVGKFVLQEADILLFLGPPHGALRLFQSIYPAQHLAPLVDIPLVSTLFVSIRLFGYDARAPRLHSWGVLTSIPLLLPTTNCSSAK
jgi:hypothetical protein